MISKFHTLLGLGALVCSAVLILGLGLANREPLAATPGDADVGVIQLLDAADPASRSDGLPEAPDATASRDGLSSLGGSGTSSSGAAPAVHRRVCRVTAYCDRGITASGVRSGVGQCAAPRDVPFGSTVYIPALGRTFVVTDRTHPRFRHNTVDIFIPSERQCLRFGRSYLECHITPPAKAGRHAPSPPV